MEKISTEMRALCEDITTSHKDRRNQIEALAKEAEAIRDNARRFVSDSKKLQQEMAKDLKKNLLENRKKLTRYVSSLREDFKKKEEAIRSDLAEASKIWNKMNKTLKAKKAERGDTR